MIQKPTDPIAEIQELKERLYDLEQRVKLLAEQLDCFQILVGGTVTDLKDKVESKP